MSNATKVYVVIQEGFYRHDIRGVYSDLKLAKVAARRAADDDTDSYHTYVVYEAQLDAYVDDDIVIAYTGFSKYDDEQNNEEY